LVEIDDLPIVRVVRADGKVGSADELFIRPGKAKGLAFEHVSPGRNLNPREPRLGRSDYASERQPDRKDSPHAWSVAAERRKIITSVRRPCLLVVPRIDRLVEAVANRVDSRFVDPEVGKIFLGYCRPPVSEGHVVLLGPSFIAIALDSDLCLRPRTHCRRDVLELMLIIWLEHRFVKIEMQNCAAKQGLKIAELGAGVGGLGRFWLRHGGRRRLWRRFRNHLRSFGTATRQTGSGQKQEA